MTPISIIILAVFIGLQIMGCMVCRHEALAHYGWAVENGYQPKIVLYTTTAATRIASLGIWNGHAQVKVGDKWIYGNPPMLHDSPEYPLGKYCWIMNLDQYVDYLKVYKELNSKPYIEREDWPRCEP